MENILLVVMLLLIGAGITVVIYYISRAAVADELDARGYSGTKGERK